MKAALGRPFTSPLGRIETTVAGGGGGFFSTLEHELGGEAEWASRTPEIK